MSGNASRTRGRARELRYRDKLRDEGWWCERIDSAADLVASRPDEQWLLQVKSTIGRYSTFLPADRAALIEEARRAGPQWRCALVWWPKGRGIDRAEWVPSEDWPSERPIAA